MKYILLGLLTSIISLLPLNYIEHFHLLNNTFNTDIFANPIIYLTPLFLLPLLIPKRITKQSLTNIKIYLPIIPILILKLIFKPQSHNLKLICLTTIIFSIILLITIKKNKYNTQINYLRIFLINLLSLIPSISLLYTFYYSIKNTNIPNKLKYSLFPFIIESLIYIKPIQLNISLLITILSSIITNIIIYYIIKPKKIWKALTYSILSSIFYLFFFR